MNTGDVPPRRARALDRLRGRVALAAAAAALLALLAAGVFVLSSVTRSDHADLDAALVARAQQAATVGRRTLRPADRTGVPPAQRATRRVGRLLGRVPGGGDVALIRIVRAGEVLDTLGATEDPGLPDALPRDPSTVETRAGRWRVTQRPMGRGIVVQTASPLAPLEARRDALTERLLLAGAGGVLLTGALAFLLAGPALGALTRLRRDAGGVATTDDLGVRLPTEAGPAEVRELADTLNAMLARLGASDADRRAALDASRRFAADAGHELRTPLTALTATVQALRDHPELAAQEREEMLAEVAEEHARLVVLLDALQALARGDAEEQVAREPVDLAELAEQAVSAARAASPDVAFALHAPERLVVDGRAPGLRLALDNLLTNAARHGRPDGHVAVTLTRDGTATTVLVDDDGLGVPDAEREAVLGRFVRGSGATAPGSGLGLALVAQQAQLHRGELRLERSPAGGLRARVTLR